MPVPAVEISDLTMRYGGRSVVDRLSMTAPAGGLTIVLGPNGAGKTTTIRMITGLLRPTHGRVEVAGHDVFEEPVEARRAMAYVPDYPFVYDKLTPDEFLGLVGDLYGVPRARASERRSRLLTRLGLDDMRYELLENLSHGTRQRVVIAAALVHDPKVIVIDEPMVGLDPRSGRIVKDLLSSGYDGGISIEPHLAVVFHDKSVTATDEEMTATYVEYGRRMEAMVERIRGEI